MTTEIAQSEYQPAAQARPNAEQLARRQRRQRFYRLRVTLPMALVTLLWLGITLLLLWLTVAGEWFAMNTNQAYYRTLVSGIADLIMILTLMPLLLLCVLPSALAIGLVVYRRNKKQDAPPEPDKLPLFWRIENVIIRIQEWLEENLLPKLARPVVSAYAAVAYVRTLFTELRQTITREINKYG